MDNSVSQQGMWEREEGRIRSVILEQNKQARWSVGLPRHSQMTALELAAYYDVDVAKRLSSQGAECDLHSACALGKLSDVKKWATEDRLGTEVEYLTPMGFAVTTGQTVSIEALIRAGDPVDRPLSRIGFFPVGD